MWVLTVKYRDNKKLITESIMCASLIDADNEHIGLLERGKKLLTATLSRAKRRK